ncbi:GspH/FimT family pseudopilin [Variovorax sp. N23]|nr:GspH/FimT family pseudopilin [Variovorax sp. N23]
MRRPVSPSRARGFTLVELMVVVTLVAVLSAIAVPGFRDLLLNQRLAASTSEFVAALSLARTEALKRAQTVTLTPLTPLTPKTKKDWNSGWEVKTAVGGVATTLRAFEALPAGVTVDTGLGNAFNGKLSYDANGFSRNGDAYQMGCVALKAETGRRSAVVVSASGRPKVCDPDRKGDCGSGQCNAAGN